MRLPSATVTCHGLVVGLFCVLRPCAVAQALPDWDDRRLTARAEHTTVTRLDSSYRWRHRIVTTCFWIGDDPVPNSKVNNFKSAWDTRWESNFGGRDDPEQRVGFRPAPFFPQLNPFYVALPFNDLAHREKAARWVPWRDTVGPSASRCHGRWLLVHFKNRFCYATWEDVGPFRTDAADYVFGAAPPRARAGLDVSPAVRDFLGLSGRDLCDWRFVEAHEVPIGPWTEYAELVLMRDLLIPSRPTGVQSLEFVRSALNLEHRSVAWRGLFP